MNSLADWALTNLVNSGIPILFLVTYIGSLGIPFPVTLLTIAAGAFSREGILDLRLAVLACLIGAALADNSEYALGRWAEKWLERRFGHKLAWNQALLTFNKQGGLAILMTRFWLTPLAPAVNLIAGSRYPYIHFLFFDTVGELLWVLLYGGLGYIFGSQWELVSQIVGDFSGISIGVVVLAAGIYFWLRWRRKKSQRRKNSRGS